MFFYFVLTLVSAIGAAAEAPALPNVKASFEESPKPFNISVDRDFIEDTRRRVEQTRPPHTIGAPDEGPSYENFTNIRDFWAKEYDWDAVEASINGK